MAAMKNYRSHQNLHPVLNQNTIFWSNEENFPNLRLQGGSLWLDKPDTAIEIT